MKKAFTLAEVLITLTIIGVIAALTIPNLMQKYEKHVLVTQLKNWYSEMSMAIGEAKAINGNLDYTPSNTTNYLTPETNNFDNTELIATLDAKYGNSLQTYPNLGRAIAAIWSDKNGNMTYKWLHGTYTIEGNHSYTTYNIPAHYPLSDYNFVRYKPYKLKSGAAMGIQFNVYDRNSSYYHWNIVVDVNGPNGGPNVVGRDVFYFYINDNARLVPTYTNTNNNLCNATSSANYNGRSCADRIIKDGWQMKY